MKTLQTYSQADSSATAAPLIAPVPQPAHALANAEIIETIRRSYPDPSQAPPEIREMIDKWEKTEGKRWVSDMKQQTSKAARAKTALSELKEAQEQHKDAWLAHLQTSASSWKDQMASYQKQQAHFGSLVAQAKQDLKEANTTIAMLNDQQSHEEEVAKTEEEPADGPSHQPVDKAAKADQLRTNIGKLLQECVDLTSEDVVDLMDDTENTGGPKKRARSVDPDAGHGS